MLLGVLGWRHGNRGVEAVTPWFTSTGTGLIKAIFPVLPTLANLGGMGQPSIAALPAVCLQLVCHLIEEE